MFGYPGGAILPAYDAMLDYPDPARPGPARAGRNAHGRRLCAGRRRRRRRDRDVGARRDEPGHRHRDRDDGLGADGLHHRPGAEQADWLRRVPGNRHHRHHAADHQAQLPGDARRRTSCRRSRKRSTWPSPAVPGPVLVDITKDAQQAKHELGVGRDAGQDARLPSEADDREERVGQGRRADQGVEEAGHPRRAGHPAERRDEGSARVRRAHQRAGRHDAARPRRRSRPAIRSTSA